MKSSRFIKRLVSLGIVAITTTTLWSVQTVQAEAVLPRTSVVGAVNTEDELWIELEGKVVSNLSTTLDYNKATINDYEKFVTALQQFPYLTRVELCESNLTNEQMEGLQNTYPNVKFVWTLYLKNYWKVRTDQVAFCTNKGIRDDEPMLYSEDVAQLKYCTDMVALDLGHNRIKDISFVEYMPNLRILILVDNRLADLSPVAHCKKLEYIETFVNRITDFSALANLANLRDVNICYNRFSDITPLLNKPRLERLFVSHCGLSTEQLDQLKAEYPDVQINHTVTQSIHGGWRKVDRYYAMRKMFKSNTVSELFTTDADWFAHYANVFDLEYYITNHPEVVEQAGTDPMEILYYFLDYGIALGHQASPNFSIAAYKEYNTELYPFCGDDLNAYFRHYMGYGYKENRIATY
ncbi:MAG: hypothetical protein IJ326_11755 [Lachnospiraceae bacterium]|nr:hypothetical protein [Lachnospiraceae bacterium]